MAKFLHMQSTALNFVLRIHRNFSLKFRENIEHSTDSSCILNVEQIQNLKNVEQIQNLKSLLNLRKLTFCIQVEIYLTHYSLNLLYGKLYLKIMNLGLEL